MNRIHEELPYESFTTESKLTRVAICPETGGLALETCPDRYTELFTADTVPHFTCTAHVITPTPTATPTPSETPTPSVTPAPAVTDVPPATEVPTETPAPTEPVAPDVSTQNVTVPSTE